MLVDGVRCNSLPDFTFLPVDAELALFDPVMDPIESHVHGFGPFDLGVAIGKPIGCGVISGDTCR